MKKIALLCSLLCLAALLIAQPVAVVSMMKVPPGGDDAYVALEKEWKKIHQARVDDGRMLAWELYYVHNQGASSPYNYATVNVYPDLKSALAGMTENDMKKMGPKWNETYNKTNTVRTLVRNEMFNWVMGIHAVGPEKFLTVSFMKINRPNTYYEMERDAYMPMHKAAIEDKKMVGWSIWNRVFAEDLEYQAVAVNGYASIDQIVGLTYGDLQEQVKKKLDLEQVVKMVNLVNDTEGIRTMIRSQLWESVDATAPKK